MRSEVLLLLGVMMRCLELSRMEETLEVYIDIFFGPFSWLIMRIESSKERDGGHWD